MAMRCNRRIRLGSEGSTTVEFALWLPLFVLLIGVAVDAAMLMHRQTQMFDVARAASRQVSLGLMEAPDAERFATDRLGGAAEIRVAGGLVTTSLSAPFSQVLVFGSRFLGGTELRASVTMVQESGGDDAGA
jgi:hypothetical protein